MTEPTAPAAPFHVPVSNLLKLAIPAVIVGIVSALTLYGLSKLAELSRTGCGTT